jgi:hypothetical protein
VQGDKVRVCCGGHWSGLFDLRGWNKVGVKLIVYKVSYIQYNIKENVCQKSRALRLFLRSFTALMNPTTSGKSVDY